jgi:hypothetical protein
MHEDNQAFRRLKIDCVIAGGTRVSWDLNPHMVDPGPYSFQLQVGHTGLTDADDWEDVGAPEIDTYYIIDDEKRTWGKTLDPHYRVKLITGVATYYSEPESCDGKLSKRDWLNAREIIRKEILRHSVLTSPEGYLLKVRRYGPRCTECTDEFTEEVSKTNCPDCYGTGFQNGYFEPMPACFADLSQPQVRDHRNPSKGMDKEYVISARFIGDTQLYSYDVWVNKTSGERYYLHTIKTAAHVRGVPIVYDAELRLAPFSDVIYTVPVGESFASSSLFSRTKAVKPCPTPAPTPQKRAKPSLNYLEAAMLELRERRRRSRKR